MNIFKSILLVLIIVSLSLVSANEDKEWIDGHNESLVLSVVRDFCRTQNLSLPKRVVSAYLNCWRGTCSYNVMCNGERSFEVNIQTLEITGYIDRKAPDYDYLELDLSTDQLKALSRKTGLIPRDAVYWKTEIRHGYAVYWKHYVYGMPVRFDSICTVIDPRFLTLNRYSKTWQNVSERAFSDYDMLNTTQILSTANDFLSKHYEGYETQPILGVQRMVYAPQRFWVGRPEVNRTSHDYLLSFEVTYCPTEYTGDQCVVVWVNAEKPIAVGTNVIWGRPDIGECLSRNINYRHHVFVARQVTELECELEENRQVINRLQNSTLRKENEIDKLEKINQELRRSNRAVIVVAILIIPLLLIVAYGFTNRNNIRRFLKEKCLGEEGRNSED